MLTFDVKRKINTLRDILVGKVPIPRHRLNRLPLRSFINSWMTWI